MCRPLTAPCPPHWPRADTLADVPPDEVPWAHPPHPGSDHAAELLRQALVADALGAAVDIGRAAGRLTVASARLAAHAAHRAGRRRRPF